MKQEFTPRGFNAEAEEIIGIAVVICELYAKKGYDLSLRQLYYQFVARGILENTEKNYKKLGVIISEARLAGRLDWDFIKDRGRRVIENTHWESPKRLLEDCAKWYRQDLWRGQPNYVMCMVEKQALEGVLEPVCRGLDIPFISNKGYSSSSTMYEIGLELHSRMEDGQDTHVIYLGDHDPSGIDMTRDIEDRLNMFSDAYYFNKEVEVHRVALNYDQVLRYEPPNNPAKLTDTRAKEYIRKFGYSSWELDALDPALLADLVKKEVILLRDDTLYEKSVEEQKDRRNKLANLARKYKEM